MAVHIVFSFVILFFLSCLPIYALADEERLTIHEPVPSAVQLSVERYEAARQAYEEQTGACLEESRRILQGNPFEGLKLSPRETEVAAFVMAGRAMAICEGAARNSFAFEIGSFKATSAHYGMSLPPQVREDAQLLFAQRWRQLEKESGEWSALSREQRLAIEKHPALQSPFDFVDMLHRLRVGRGE